MTAAKEIETIALKAPITLTLKRAGGEAREEVISELEFHPFKARDMRAIDGLGENAGSIILSLIARMTRQPVAVIDELGPEDFALLAGKAQAFLPSGPLIGGTD